MALGCGPLLRLDGAVRLAVAADDLCVTLDVPDTVGLCGTLTLAEVCAVWLCVMPRHEVLAMENRSTASEVGERIVRNTWGAFVSTCTVESDTESRRR